eukprot:CAMPEP_0184693328 /NCGR_PEP_ID=MMETSP0313-20130426/1566_1 /TAXON_ID=2792 /ORGANISM="Porphyridium aerugineum, Strain SAG 1380-2" /LENGTH=1171 /DNA_ID=CAMNT_0027151379 /DNA_START=249 /DNA_END=3764 /DNA_ORIENTATION=+
MPGINELDVARQYSETSARVAQAIEKEKKGKKGKEAKERDQDELKKELEMWEHKLPVDELCARLETHPENGLTSAKAAEIFARDGPNILSPPKTTPLWIRYLLTYTDFFSLLLTGASILCFIGFGLDSTNMDNIYLGSVLIVVVVITSTFGFMQNYKSEKTMEMFRNFLPPQALVHRDGKLFQIPASDLVVGDVVDVKLGDKIPADLRVILNSKLKVDNSSLTGEPEPQARSVDCTDENPLETKNLAFFGTSAVDGTATAVVVQTGDRTVFGRIAGLAASGGNDITTLEIEIHKFVIGISIYAISMGILFFIIGCAKGTEILTNIIFTIAIIVANVPEGLLVTVTVSLTLAAKRMAKKQVLVKTLPCVETLGSTTAICSDKTGTLTQNRMTVVHLMYGDKIETTKTATTEVSYDVNDPLFKEAFYVMVNCSKADFDAQDLENNPNKPIQERLVNGDASEAGILKFCEQVEPVAPIRAKNPKIGGIPFNSTNKFMVSIHKDGENPGMLRQCFKGAPERVLERCSKIVTLGGEVELDAALLAKVNEHLQTLMENGERVLGLAKTSYAPPSEAESESFFDQDNPKFPMNGLTFVGLVALLDPPRESVPGAVARCQTAGIQVVMVTGDHPDTAKAIAKIVKIIRDPTAKDIAKAKGIPIEQVDPSEVHAVVVPGWELKDFEEDDWNRVLAHKQIVFARTSPQQKLIIVENFQRIGHVVAVTGDGVNDSPALKKANIGVAMGISGSDVSKEAADMILLDDNFSSIVSGVEEGRLIFDNLKKSIAYTVSANIPEVAPFLVFVITGIPSALSTILILCIDLGTDMIPAISFAYEKAEADIMDRPPRNAKKDRLVTKTVVGFSYFLTGFYQAMTGYFAYIMVFNDYGISPSLLPGLNSKEYFGAPSDSEQRWWFTVNEAYDKKSFNEAFFTNDGMFQKYFSATPPAGFITMESDEFNKLTPTLDSSVTNPIIGQPLSGASNNTYFNNMAKAAMTELKVPYCLEFSCTVGTTLYENDYKACIEDFAATSTVFYTGVNTGVLNLNVNDQTGCIISWTHNQQKQTWLRAQTAFFDSVIIVRCILALVCKTRLLPLTFRSIYTNVWHTFGVFSMVALICILTYVPGLNTAFGAAPLMAIHWLLGLPWAAIMLFIAEFRKWVFRYHKRNPDKRLARWCYNYGFW